MATALTLNQYSNPEKPLIHNARSYDIMQRRIIQQLFDASSKKNPANVALELIHHHIDIRNALIAGRPDRYVPPIDFDDYFVFRLWKILFKMASKLYMDWERERLVSFVLHLGKYFYPVRGRMHMKMDHIWGPLFIMRPRLLDFLDEERFLITDDPVLNIPWDRIKFDWGFFPSTERSVVHAFKELADPFMSSRTTNLHAFMVKLTRDGTFNAISVALSALRMVLGGLMIHPSDLLFYNPVAVVNGTAQKLSYPADPYRSEALASEDTLYHAEAAFKAAASWVKLVGKEFFVRYAEHESFIPEWLFWTKRFEEIAQSRFAAAEVKQLAIECAESMTVISVRALDFESLKNSLESETASSHKYWDNSSTVEEYLGKVQRERDRSRIVVTNTQPPILFSTWWEILTSDVAYGFKASSACHAATARIPKPLCPDHCLQAKLTNQLHLEQGQANRKSGQ